MKQADDNNTKRYSYEQSLRFNDSKDIKKDRGVAIIKKLNRNTKKDDTKVFSSLYQLLGA